MRTRVPNPEEIAELVAFLPRLYAEGFQPIKAWHGGTRNAQGALTLPWPDYNDVVEAFFRAASRDCWLDYNYSPEEAAQLLRDEDRVRNAGIDEIKTMLTFCVRGERFSDGHWGAMVEGGYVRRLLERLAEIGGINHQEEQ